MNKLVQLLAFCFSMLYGMGLFAQPIVELGPDTVACGSILLDAGNPGATYLWSTGDNTQTVLISQSDTIWVDVTDGSGTTRDSIWVQVLAVAPVPQTSDVSRCGPGDATLNSTIGTSAQLLWWSDSIGGQIVTAGDSLSTNVSDTTSFYVEARNWTAFSLGAFENNVGTGGTFSTGNGRGFRFDAFQDLIIQGVSVYPQANSGAVPLEFDIELRDANNVVLRTEHFSFLNPASVKTLLPLWYSVSTGTDYRLVVNNLAGGRLFLNFNDSSLPYTLPGIARIVNSTPNSGEYYFLYDWQIVTEATSCISDRIQATINVVPSPVVDLGEDTVLCGNDPYTLDATFSGATYIWSTGNTMATQAVTASDTYRVEVFLGQCGVEDSIIIDRFDSPMLTQVVSDSICGADNVFLSASTTAQTLLWYNLDNDSTILGFGDSLPIFVTQTDTFLTEAVNAATLSLGAEENNVGTGTAFSSGNGRGFRFQAFRSFVIKSVSVYPSTSLSVDIELRDAGGTVLSTRHFDLVNPSTREELELWMSVPQGSDYQLVINNLQGGLLSLNFNDSNLPYTLDGVGQITTSVPSAGEYYFLYDWQLVLPEFTCNSARDTAIITVLPSPMVSLGNDTVLCQGASLTLDVTNPGATYLWNDGSTDSSLTVSSTDTIDVLVDLFGCTETDTVVLAAFDLQTPPVILDTAVCGPDVYTFTAGGDGQILLWYDSLTQNTILASGPSATFELVDTTTFYLQSLGALPTTLGPPSNQGVGTGGTYSSGNERGIEFDAYQSWILSSITVYPQLTGAGPMSLDIELRNAQDSVLQVRSFSFSNPQAEEILDLWMNVEAGTGYKLVINNLLGGRLYLSFNDDEFPYETAGVGRLIRSLPTAGDYFFLYNWQIALENLVCRSPIMPFTVDVLDDPVVDLGGDTVLCGGNILTLDAENAGATFLWSTGDTTQTLNVDTPAVYTVSVALQTCIQEDSIQVDAFAIPDLPSIEDTSLCGPGIIELAVLDTAQSQLWWNSSAGGLVLSSGDSVAFPISDTSTYYVEYGNAKSEFMGRGVAGGSPGGFSAGDNRGLIFDADAPFLIKSLKVYPDLNNFLEPLEATIDLISPNGDILQRRVFTLDSEPDSVRWDVWFQVPDAGTGYRIVLSEIIGGRLFLNFNDPSFPYELEGVGQISGSTQPTDYYYFYDWEIWTPQNSCLSGRKSVEVVVVLPLELPSYIYSCEDTLIEGGDFPANYLWSTGETSADILVQETGTYILTVDDGADCIVEDTVEVEIPENAGLPDDGILCGGILTTNYGEDAIYLWSTGDTTPTLTISQPDTFSVTVLEPRGCLLTDTVIVTGFDEFPVVNLGQDIAACDSLMLDAGNPGLDYFWSNGDTTQQITVFASGTYYVIATNENGCAGADTIGVSISPQPVADFFVPDTIYSPGLSVSFINLSSLGSYQWDLGDGATSSSTNPVHIYSDTGFYCVQLIVSDIFNDCGLDTIERCFQLLRSNVGITALAPIEVSLSPNPVISGQTTVHLPELGAYFWELTDMTGKVLRRGKWSGVDEAILSLKGLPQGIYGLNIRNQGRRSFEKIIYLSVD